MAVTLGRVAPTVAATERVAIELAPELASPAIARRLVAAALAGRGLDPGMVDVAVLVVSELVTNSVCYASGPVLVELTTGTGRVRITVSDEVSGGPRSEQADDFAERGRGLLIVDALATRWGVQTSPSGKRVWFELDIGQE